MDLKRIRYFVAVAESGSFTAGARRAFVTQATLSAAIAALEAEMGTRLLERLPRGVALTSAGSRTLIHARAVLREVETMKARGQRSVPIRPLRLGLLPTMPSALVAAALAKINRHALEQPWRTDDAPFGQLRQRLASGRYDAIFTSLGKAERGHRQIVLHEDTLALALPKAGCPKGRVTPEILQGRPLIVRTHCEYLQAASRILDDWNVTPFVIARTDSDARALEMVAAGIGACLMPDSFHHDDVIFVRPVGVKLNRRLGLEWIKGAGGGWFDTLADEPAAFRARAPRRRY